MEIKIVQSEGQECIYVQDLKACTVPNGVWYHPGQAIVLHVADDEINGKLKIRSKKYNKLATYQA